MAGIVLAGSADFKTELGQSDMFDGRLAAKVLKVVDVSYGGENGFNQAIELASETLGNVKFIQEKKLISKYFDEVSQDTGLVCFGVKDTMQGLEAGAVETLILWENLQYTRYQFSAPEGQEEGNKHVIYLRPDEIKDGKDKAIDEETGADLELEDKCLLIEWLANNYKTFGMFLPRESPRSLLFALRTLPLENLQDGVLMLPPARTLFPPPCALGDHRQGPTLRSSRIAPRKDHSSAVVFLARV